MNMSAVRSRRYRPQSCGVIKSPSLQNKKETQLMHKNYIQPLSISKRRSRRSHCSISYTSYIYFIIISSINCTYGQDSLHFFCGTSWGDASDNCDERQHCPTGTDDECETEGHICFGGTTCNSKQGHGNKFKYANVAYDDISNTRFCGSGWQGAIDHCSIDTHCPSGFTEECPEGYSCYGGLPCNVKDILEALEEANISPDGDDSSNRIDKHSPQRHNFCGSSWADANSKCSIWCPSGEAVDCPGGMNCFGSTGCYYSADLVPTSTPISEAPTLEPTPSPAAYKDPMNVRYCGTSWSMAVLNCSPETWCPGGTSDECPKGQSCHAGITECNMVDLMAKEKGGGDPNVIPTRPPLSSEDPRNSKFCGKSWQLASDNCSLNTHCPDDQCPAGDVCYGGINGCNANEMTHSPSGRPTQQPSGAPSPKPTNPTQSPSFSPTTLTKAPFTDHPTISSLPTPAPMIDADDMRHSYWCGKDWADVTEHCHEPCINGQDTECPDDFNCIAFTSCRPKTPPPTNKPNTASPSPPPVQTPRPVTDTPSRNPIKSTLPPTELVTQDSNTEEAVIIPDDEPPSSFSPISMKPIAEPAWEEPKRTFQPSNRPSPKPITPLPTKPTTPPQAALPPSSKASIPSPSPELIASVGSVLVAASNSISNNVLVRTDMMTKQQSPSQMYQFSGFINALGIISKGDMGSNYFYLGSNPEQPNYGLANVALFLAQAAVESVQYDVCDDISWEKDVFGRYPIANSCGQGKSLGGTSYEETNPCSADEAYMACDIDVEMKAVAKTHGIFSGAPPPLECYPSTPTEPFTGAWNPAMSCIEDGCNAYTGQTMGSVDDQSIPTANSFGTKSVGGCCWWGRGPYPRGASGTCMIGKLNYYLGKRAFDEDRPSARYEVDFCKDPSGICRGYDETNSEIRWLVGLMYWMNKVQTYNRNDWSYMIKLHEFVDGGFRDGQFVTAVSGIITKGRHDSTPILPAERMERFDKIMDYFNRAQSGTLDEEEVEEISMATMKPTPLPSSMREPTFPPVEQTNPPSSRSPSDHPSAHPTPRQAAKETRAPVVPLPLIELLPVGEDGTVLTSSSETAEEDENYSLTPSELAQRLNFENNYCATSAEEAEAKCATSLRTCNFDDDPCTFGLACYGNVACQIKWSDGFDSVTTDEEESSPPTDNEASPLPDSPSGPISCNGICLRPLSSNECLAGGDVISILPDCFASSIGEMCQTEDNECINDETTGYISACPGGRHAFMHVIEELCVVLSTEIPSTDSSLEPKPAPSTNNTNTTSSSSSESHTNTNVTNLNDTNITNPQDDSSAAEDSGEVSWTPDDYDDNRPGAWWVLTDSSNSNRCSTSIMMLFLTMVFI